MTSTFSSQYSMKRSIFTASVAVQTESVVVGHGSHSQPIYGPPTQMDTGEDHAANLSAGDLAAILQWSKDLSRDINLSSGEKVLSICPSSARLHVCSAPAAYGDLDRDVRIIEHLRYEGS